MEDNTLEESLTERFGKKERMRKRRKGAVVTKTV
jgi:hypothetical protein